MRRTRVYIGSSEEGLGKARILAALVEEIGDATLWKDGFFELGHFRAEDVQEKASAYDFSVHLVTPDLIAGEDQDAWPGALLEFGMFMSVLGRDRAFLLVEDGVEIELPESIRGLRQLAYKPREDMTAAISNVLQPFRQAVDRLGIRRPDFVKDLGRLDTCSIYLAAPHTNTSKNGAVARTLSKYGLSVSLPNDLVKAKKKTGATPKEIREICVAAISNCEAVVVDLDTYGLDTAWEIGFADAREIDVIGLSTNQKKMVDKRTVNRRPYRKNFMHGWDEFSTITEIGELETYCEGRNVYVCGSFKNERGIESIRSSKIRALAEGLVIPKDDFKIDKKEDHTVSWITKQRVIKGLAESDLALVLLPRYGMDTSWQLGYAAGLGVETIGFVGKDSGRASELSRIWDHWMHGWREKVVLLSDEDLASLLLGRLAVNDP